MVGGRGTKFTVPILLISFIMSAIDSLRLVANAEYALFNRLLPQCSHLLLNENHPLDPTLSRNWILLPHLTHSYS